MTLTWPHVVCSCCSSDLGQRAGRSHSGDQKHRKQGSVKHFILLCLSLSVLFLPEAYFINTEISITLFSAVYSLTCPRRIILFTCEINIYRPSESCIKENSSMVSSHPPSVCRSKPTCCAVNCDRLTCKRWSWSRAGPARWSRTSFRPPREHRTPWCRISVASGCPNTTTSHLSSARADPMPGKGTVGLTRDYTCSTKKTDESRKWRANKRIEGFWHNRWIIENSQIRRAAVEHVPCCVFLSCRLFKNKWFTFLRTLMITFSLRLCGLPICKPMNHHRALFPFSKYLTHISHFCGSWTSLAWQLLLRKQNSYLQFKQIQSFLHNISCIWY